MERTSQTKASKPIHIGIKLPTNKTLATTEFTDLPYCYQIYVDIQTTCIRTNNNKLLLTKRPHFQLGGTRTINFRRSSSPRWRCGTKVAVEWEACMWNLFRESLNDAACLENINFKESLPQSQRE